MRNHKDTHCKWCWKTLPKTSLFKHQETCIANTEKVMFQCTECSFESASKYVPKAHMKTHLPDQKVKSKKSPKKEIFEMQVL